MDVTATKSKRFMNAVPEKDESREGLKIDADIYGGEYPGDIADEACDESVLHFFDGGYAEVKREDVKDGFTAAGHYGGGPAGKGIRPGLFHNAFHDDQGAAS